ncbi:HTTM domain-containing protein [Streptomyces sp. NPDC048361]|uniref:HTTM domain-containing protein n=1 Tax=Streptomyces sp. NPDC048361 TaxID=3154720 RepID=UPI00341BA9FC
MTEARMRRLTDSLSHLAEQEDGLAGVGDQRGPVGAGRQPQPAEAPGKCSSTWSLTSPRHRPASGTVSLAQPTARGTAFAAFWALRIQLVILYAQSGISKFGVPDRLNGSAEYYILRDPIFGAAEPFKGPVLWLSEHGPTLALLAWGGIIIELVIAAFLLGPERWRKVAFVLDVLLHASIIATIGLWSFSLIMTRPSGCGASASS